MGSIILSVFSGLFNVFPKLAESVGGTIVKLKDTEAARQGNENKSGLDLALGYMQTVAETNKIKAENMTERRIVAAFLLFALPTGIHWWAVILDSMPWFGHVVGSWKIAAPPGEWGITYHEIIRSFFFGAPALAGAALLARAFRR